MCIKIFCNASCQMCPFLSRISTGHIRIMVGFQSSVCSLSLGSGFYGFSGVKVVLWKDIRRALKGSKLTSSTNQLGQNEGEKKQIAGLSYSSLSISSPRGALLLPRTNRVTESSVRSVVFPRWKPSRSFNKLFDEHTRQDTVRCDGPVQSERKPHDLGIQMTTRRKSKFFCGV